MNEEPIAYPIRLNRYLALRGVATRRGADELIASGKVTIDGRVAKLGEKVEGPSQKVEVSRSARRSTDHFTYLAYYKPRGIITHSPQGAEQEIADISGHPGTFPVGRLDKGSEGLILLTDDGRVTERLLHPRFEHEKEYRATVREAVRSQAVRILESGVESDGELLTAKRVTVRDPHTLEIVLTEGKKHQIRRMLDKAHLTVERLVRVRIMGISLGSLTPGQSRPITGRAREMFLRDLGLAG